MRALDLALDVAALAGERVGRFDANARVKRRWCDEERCRGEREENEEQPQ
jgi:hypothetical protein